MTKKMVKGLEHLLYKKNVRELELFSLERKEMLTEVNAQVRSYQGV